MKSEVQATVFTGLEFGKVKQNLPKFYLARRPLVKFYDTFEIKDSLHNMEDL
jgi:hypothetical protein